MREFWADFKGGFAYMMPDNLASTLGIISADLLILLGVLAVCGLLFCVVLGVGFLVGHFVAR